MNRRKFLGRIGAAAAVVPVVAKMNLPTREELPSLPAQADAPVAPVADRPIVAPTRPTRTLFELRCNRGLISRCPNPKCGALAWANLDARWPHLKCGACGWIVSDVTIASCPCRDCTQPPRVFVDVLGDALPMMERSAIGLQDFEVGKLYVVTQHGVPLERVEQNAYDVNTGLYIHDVRQRRVARTVCGIRARLREARGETWQPSGDDFLTVEQPNGDYVFLGWHIVDWHEKHVAEGRA